MKIYHTAHWPSWLFWRSCVAGAARPRARRHAGRAEALHDADAQSARKALLRQLHGGRRSQLVGVARRWAALVSANSNSYRVPGVRIRVGDYKFDNTNFTGGGGGGARYDLRNFPLDDDPW